MSGVWHTKKDRSTPLPPPAPAIPELPPPPPSADPLLTLADASLGHAVEELQGQAAPSPTLSAVNLTLRPGMRVLLAGRIGSGKSTLLASLAGRLPLWPDAGGMRRCGRGLQLLCWDQTAREFAEEETPVEFVIRLAGGASDDETALSVLGGLGLDRFAARRTCSALSSGERTLVALAALSLLPRNLLLLDEPFAFLGAVSSGAVAEALSPARWAGALVFTAASAATRAAMHVSHVAHITGGSVQLYTAAEWAAAAVDEDAPHGAAGGASSSGQPPPAAEPALAEERGRGGAATQAAFLVPDPPSAGDQERAAWPWERARARGEAAALGREIADF